MSTYTCLCGGHAYTRDDMLALCADDPEWAEYWRSMLGSPDSMYCSDEDDILTEMEAWRVMGLKLPVHDEDWALGVCGEVWDGKGDPAQELIW